MIKKSIYKLPYRFLFKQNEKYMRLFWLKFENEELYLGSSLKQFQCAGIKDVKTIIQDNNNYQIEIDDTLQLSKFNSLKFSFHESGVRQLKIKNDEMKMCVQLYREKYFKLDEVAKPDLLFAIISKQISLYSDYKSKLIKDKTNAVVLNTPSELSTSRNIFEFYICNDETIKDIPDFMVPSASKEELIIELKKNIYLYIKYCVIVSNENSLNKKFLDREILIFKDNGILKSFGFK